MPRNTRNTAILAKIEATYGLDAAPTGALNALLVSDASFDISYNNVERNNLKGFFGADEQLAGTRFVDLSFSVEISGSGAAGTAPAYGVLLRACGMAETITAAARVEYNPISTAQQSITIYYHDDGVLHKALGCMGNVTLAMGEGERPLLKFTFAGLDGGISATATPALTLTAWKAPLVITDANSGDVKLGSIYAAGVLTGGTAYPSRGLSLDLGNDVKKIALLGGQSADITDRQAKGSVQLELTAVQEVAMFADVNDNTLTSLCLEHGSAAGAKVLVFAPNVQRSNPKHVDFEGRIHHTFDLRLLPVTGNDELRIVVL